MTHFEVHGDGSTKPRTYVSCAHSGQNDYNLHSLWHLRDHWALLQVGRSHCHPHSCNHISKSVVSTSLKKACNWLTFPWGLAWPHVWLVHLLAPLKTNDRVSGDDLGWIKLGMPVYRCSDIGLLVASLVKRGNALQLIHLLCSGDGLCGLEVPRERVLHSDRSGRLGWFCLKR